MRKYKYFVLTLMLISVMILESLGRRAGRGPVVSDLFLLIVGAVVFVVVFQGRRERIVAFVAAAASLTITWSRHLPIVAESVVSLEIAPHVLQAVFLAFAVAVILRNHGIRRFQRREGGNQLSPFGAAVQVTNPALKKFRTRSSNSRT